MQYLKLARGRWALLLFVGSSLLFFGFPALDLRVTSLFYNGRTFPWAYRWWAALLQDSVAYFVVGAVAIVVGLYLVNVLVKRRFFGIDGKAVCYILLVLIVGVGVTVNFILKDHFGRARPRHVTEFGGKRQFTPAFVVSNACSTNCSFASGDAAGAFFAFALAIALGRRRAMLLAAATFGILVSFARIAAGAHFLSDTLVAGFVMWLTADVLHFYLLPPARAVALSTASSASDRPELGQESRSAGIPDPGIVD